MSGSDMVIKSELVAPPRLRGQAAEAWLCLEDSLQVAEEDGEPGWQILTETDPEELAEMVACMLDWDTISNSVVTICRKFIAARDAREIISGG